MISPSDLFIKLYRKPKTLLCLLFVITQQLLVAASTLFIMKLGESIATQNNEFLHYLLLFVTTLSLVYLPGICGVVLLQKVKYTAFLGYVESFREANKMHAYAINDSSLRKQNEPFLTHEAHAVLDEGCDLIFNVVSTLCNAIFNTILIGIAINPFILVAYGISFFLLFSTGLVFKPLIVAHSASMQNGRKNMTQILLSGWENILIGNSYNLNLWNSIFKKNWQIASNSTARYEAIVHGASALGMLLALIPISTVIIWLFYENSTNWPILAALVVTLPRQIQILQNIFTLFYQFMQWNGVRTKLQGVLASLSPQVYDDEKMINRIKWNKINLLHEGIVYSLSSMDDVLTIILNKKGRFTIQGENGVGKSTLLCLLKNKIGDNAFYLPSSSALLFENYLNKSASSGQKMLSCFIDIHESVKEVYLLLDEWDANLDAINAKKTSDKINDLARYKHIVEVRHTPS